MTIEISKRPHWLGKFTARSQENWFAHEEGRVTVLSPKEIYARESIIFLDILRKTVYYTGDEINTNRDHITRLANSPLERIIGKKTIFTYIPGTPAESQKNKL